MRVLLSGVEIWKVTLSKSEAIWSMEVGVALKESAAVLQTCRLFAGLTPERNGLLAGSQ